MPKEWAVFLFLVRSFLSTPDLSQALASVKKWLGNLVKPIFSRVLELASYRLGFLDIELMNELLAFPCAEL